MRWAQCRPACNVSGWGRISRAAFTPDLPSSRWRRRRLRKVFITLPDHAGFAVRSSVPTGIETPLSFLPDQALP